MSTKNVTLHDENGNVLLPATKTSRITDANGTGLDTLLQQAGQVKSISVNGVTQTIDANGNVNIASADGVGIASVVQTTTSTEDGGTNVITVTKTDNTTSTFSVKNGSKGSTGATGPQGERGLPGESGVTGDVSGFTVIQTIDPSATYGATDIAGAATVQATNAELTELGGAVEKNELELYGTTSYTFHINKSVRYLHVGYGRNLPAWCCTDKFGAGVYTVPVLPSGLQFGVYKYVTDTSGVTIHDTANVQRTFTVAEGDQYIITIRNTSSNLSDSDYAAIETWLSTITVTSGKTTIDEMRTGIAGKVNASDVDDKPTIGSDNWVKSKGIFNSIDESYNSAIANTFNKKYEVRPVLEKGRLFNQSGFVTSTAYALSQRFKAGLYRITNKTNTTTVRYEIVYYNSDSSGTTYISANTNSQMFEAVRDFYITYDIYSNGSRVAVLTDEHIELIRESYTIEYLETTVYIPTLFRNSLISEIYLTGASYGEGLYVGSLGYTIDANENVTTSKIVIYDANGNVVVVIGQSDGTLCDAGVAYKLHEANNSGISGYIVFSGKTETYGGLTEVLTENAFQLSKNPLIESYLVSDVLPNKLGNIADGSNAASMIASAQTAVGTSYSNTNSGLQATNVQDAIDKIDTDVDSLKVSLQDVNDEVDSFEQSVTEQINSYAPISITGNVENAPDEEDLTSVTVNSSNVLKLKNRNNINGRGYIILRSGNSFASQLTQTNTIYEIRYNFDLGNTSVTIPTDCVLKFNGGKLSNGTIVGQNTSVINMASGTILNCHVTGTIKSDFKVSWLGLSSSYDTDNIVRLKEAVTSVHNGNGDMIWDTDDIYILYDDNNYSNSLPLRTGVNDFSDTTFHVKSTATNYSFLLSYIGETFTLVADTIEDAVANELFTDDTGVLIVTDNTDITSRIGYGYGATRVDLIMVQKNMAINKPILPYDDADSDPSFSYFKVDYDGITVKNLNILRDADSTGKSYPAEIRNAYNLIIENVYVNTPSSELYGDYAFLMYSIYKLTVKDFMMDGTYSATNHSGYALDFNNVYGAVLENVNSNGMWGITGSNSINGCYLYNCNINRLDCHCYSRDFICKNCTFIGLHNDITAHFGYMIYDSCIFDAHKPIFISKAYNVLTDYNVTFTNCVFKNVDRLLELYSDPVILAFSRRAVVKDSYIPKVTINNCTWEITDSSITSVYIYKYAINYTSSYYYVNRPVVKIDGLNIINTQPVSLFVCDDTVSEGHFTFNDVRQTVLSRKTLSFGTSPTPSFVNSFVTFSNCALNCDYTMCDNSNLIEYNKCVLHSLANADLPKVEFTDCKIVLYINESNLYGLTTACVYKRCNFVSADSSVNNLPLTDDKYVEFDHCTFDTTYISAVSAVVSAFEGFDVIVRNAYVYPNGMQIATSTDITRLFTATYVPVLDVLNMTTKALEHYENKQKQ